MLALSKYKIMVVSFYFEFITYGQGSPCYRLNQELQEIIDLIRNTDSPIRK